MRAPDARSVVAVVFAVTICFAVLAPIAGRLFGMTEQPLPEIVVASLADLLKYVAGGVIGWLASAPKAKEG